MPWKLIAPHTRTDGKKIEFYYVRGKYCGIRLNHSTGTGEARAAQRILRTWRDQAERGEFAIQTETQPRDVTFAAAATAYMRAGGDGQYLEQIIAAWPQRLAHDVDQIAIDTLASQLYPTGTAATRNRQVYTPVAAVLHRAGIEKKIKRPVGWKGKRSTSWLEPPDAFSVLAAAEEIDTEFALLCWTLLYTGVRLGEALDRNLRDIALERAFLYLEDTKNGEPRGCHLPPVLVERFKSQPPRHARLLIERGQKGFIKGGGGRAVDDAGLPFLERSPDAKLFRFHDGGRLRDMLKDALGRAGVSLPRRQGGFHLFRHTWAAWMRRFGGLDTSGLVATGAWADRDSASRYEHTDASDSARKSDLLPTPGKLQSWQQKAG